MFQRGNTIWLSIILILLVSRIMTRDFDLLGTLYMLPGLILALTFHEYAHAKASDRLGDPTPEREGRLTLNPLSHMDPMGTICLLFAGFGWGKPVSINPTYYRNSVKDSAIVAAAGPIMNFILAFVLFFVFGLLSVFLPVSNVASIVLIMVLYAAGLNLSLGVFNLLPLPPLDGSKIIVYFLKGKAREFMYTLENYSYIIILILFMTSLPSKIISPLIELIASGMINTVAWIFELIGLV